MIEVTCCRLNHEYSLVAIYGYLDCTNLKDHIRIDNMYIKDSSPDTAFALLMHLDALAIALCLPIIGVIEIDESPYYLKLNYRIYERADGKTLVTKSINAMKPLPITIYGDTDPDFVKNPKCCFL